MLKRRNVGTPYKRAYALSYIYIYIYIHTHYYYYYYHYYYYYQLSLLLLCSSAASSATKAAVRTKRIENLARPGASSSLDKQVKTIADNTTNNAIVYNHTKLYNQYNYNHNIYEPRHRPVAVEPVRVGPAAALEPCGADL